MKNHFLMVLLNRFFIVFLIIFSFSCKKETPNNYVQFPIELTITETPNNIKLSWTKIETSDFIDYVIVQATTDTVPELSKISINPSAFVLGRIADPQITTFTFTQFSSQNIRTNFRVFARLNARTLSSKNVVINADVIDLGNSFQEIITNNSKSNPRFYLFGNASFSNSTIIAYDPKEERVAATNNTLGSKSFRLAVASKNEANEEVAAFTNNSINFLDATTLQLLSSMTLSSSENIVAGTGTTDGFFIFITTEVANNVKVVSVLSHIIVSQYTLALTYPLNIGSVLTRNPAQREFILRDPNTSNLVKIARIQYSEQGQITDSGANGVVLAAFTSPTPVLRISNNGELFIVNNLLCTRTLVTKANLVSALGATYADFAFSPQGDKFYGYITTNSSFASIDEYDIATLKILRTIPTKLPSFRCFALDNTLVVFSNSNFTGQTAVQKIIL